MSLLCVLCPQKMEAALLEHKKEREAGRKRSKASDLPSVDMVRREPSHTSLMEMSHHTLQMNSVISDCKVFRRERKNSNSSTVSSASSYSAPARPKRRPPPKTPKRASSAPLIGVTTPPMELHQQHGTPQVSGSPASSSPLHSQCHAPLQMFPLLPLLPFMAPPTPHPHFVYGPVPQLPPTIQTGQDHLDSLSAQSHPQALSGQLHPTSVQPHPFAYNVLWNGQVTDASSAVPSSLQPAWVETKQVQQSHVTGGVAANLALPENRSIGHTPASHHVTCNSVDNTGQPSPGSPLATPPGMGGCGPAQGFYSLLNNKDLTSDPSSTIWTPTSSNDPSGMEEGEWPEWPDTSTQ